MNKKLHKHLLRLTFSALFLALAYVLPIITGYIPEIGQALSPMHIPVLLCGFVCGPVWGLAVGAIAPLTRSLMFGMPHMYPTALCMAFELAAYGAMTGILYRVFSRKKSDGTKTHVNVISIYASLILSMIVGRIVWGTARFICAGLDPSKFGLAAFWAGAVTNAIPGIIVHIILVPAIMIVLERMRIVSNSGDSLL